METTSATLENLDENATENIPKQFDDKRSEDCIASPSNSIIPLSPIAALTIHDEHEATPTKSKCSTPSNWEHLVKALVSLFRFFSLL